MPNHTTVVFNLTAVSSTLPPTEGKTPQSAPALKKKTTDTHESWVRERVCSRGPSKATFQNLAKTGTAPPCRRPWCVGALPVDVDESSERLFKNTSYSLSLFKTHICWSLKYGFSNRHECFRSGRSLAIAQGVQRARIGHLSCHDSTSSVAGRGTTSLAVGREELHLTFMRLVRSLKNLSASCTPSVSTCTALRIEICINSRTFVSGHRVQVCSETRPESPGHRLSITCLSRKRHDFHREVTKRSPSLDPRPLAFRDSRLIPHGWLHS